MASIQKNTSQCNKNYKVKHAIDLRSKMSVLRNFGKWCDITLIAGIDGQRIAAHRLILSSSSAYFSAMFNSYWIECNKSEVVLKNVHGDQLSLLVQYCYSGELSIGIDNVQDILSTASLLQFNEVLNMCARFLENQLHPSNCLGFDRLAEHYSCRRLKLRTEEYICEHFDKVRRSQEFLQLSPDSFAQLIAGQNIGVSSEDMIFGSLMTWINYDRSQRYTQFRSLLPLVRLSLISESYLSSFVEPICRLYNCVDILREKLKLKASKKTLERARKGNAGLIAVFHGSDNDDVIIEKYCPIGDNWRPYGELPLRRYGFGTALLGDQLFIIGGCSTDEREIYNTVECYDLITKSSKLQAPILTKRNFLCAAAVDGLIYAAGGKTERNTILSTVECYDPKKGSWSFVTPMLIGKSSAAAVALAGKLYVIGGSDTNNDSTKTTQMYDPETSKWNKMADMIYPRSMFSISANKGDLYVMGGLPCETSHRVERYDSKQNEWHFLYSLSDTPNIAYGTFLSCDRIMAVTTIENNMTMLSVEEFNIQTRQYILGDETPEYAVDYYYLCGVYAIP